MLVLPKKLTFPIPYGPCLRTPRHHMLPISTRSRVFEHLASTGGALSCTITCDLVLIPSTRTKISDHCPLSGGGNSTTKKTTRRRTPGSEVGNHLSVTASSEPLIRSVINRLRQQVHRTIHKQELCTPGMIRTESPRKIPLVSVPALRMRIPSALGLGLARGTRGHRVQGDRGRGMGIALSVVTPPAFRVTAVTRWKDLADKNRVGRTVRDVMGTNRRSHARHHAGKARLTPVRITVGRVSPGILVVHAGPIIYVAAPILRCHSLRTETAGVVATHEISPDIKVARTV